MDNTERIYPRSGAWRAEALYTTLQAMPVSWYSRAEIANAIGKGKLNISEQAALDRLAEAGRIERRIAAAPRSEFNQRLEYRLVNGSNTVEPTAEDTA